MVVDGAEAELRQEEEDCQELRNEVAVGVPLSLPSLAALDSAQGPLPEVATCPSSTTTTQALTMTIPDNDELREVEQCCRGDYVALPFADPA